MAALGERAGVQGHKASSNVGGAQRCRADLHLAIAQRQGVECGSSRAIGRTGVEADGHTGRGVLGIGGNDQACWRCRRRDVKRNALRGGDGGPVGRTTDCADGNGDGVLGSLCQRRRDIQCVMKCEGIRQDDGIATADRIVDLVDHVADNVGNCNRSVIGTGTGCADCIARHRDDGGDLHCDFLNIRVERSLGVELGKADATQAVSQAQGHGNVCGRRGNQRGIHHRARMVRDLLRNHGLNQCRQRVDGACAHRRLEYHRIDGTGVHVDPAKYDEAALWGAGEDKEVAVGIGEADEVVAGRIGDSVIVGVDVDRSAAHIAVKYNTTDEAGRIVAENVLDRAAIVTGGGVGVGQADQTRRNRVGQLQGQTAATGSNAGHRVGIEAELGNKSTRRRRMQGVQLAVEYQSHMGNVFNIANRQRLNGGAARIHRLHRLGGGRSVAGQIGGGAGGHIDREVAGQARLRCNRHTVDGAADNRGKRAIDHAAVVDCDVSHRETDDGLAEGEGVGDVGTAADSAGCVVGDDKRWRCHVHRLHRLGCGQVGFVGQIGGQTSADIDCEIASKTRARGDVDFVNTGGELRQAAFAGVHDRAALLNRDVSGRETGYGFAEGKRVVDRAAGDVGSRAKLVVADEQFGRRGIRGNGRAR